MLNSIDKTLLRVKPINFYETPSVYDSNTTLYGGGGKLGIEKCEKSALRSTILATIVCINFNLTKHKNRIWPKTTYHNNLDFGGTASNTMFIQWRNNNCSWIEESGSINQNVTI